MTASRLIFGIAIAIPALISGMLVNQFVWAQEKEASSEWTYKVVRIADTFRTLQKIKPLPTEELTVEFQLNKHGANGWELVSYTMNDNVGIEALAIYRKKAKP